MEGASVLGLGKELLVLVWFLFLDWLHDLTDVRDA